MCFVKQWAMVANVVILMGYIWVMFLFQSVGLGLGPRDTYVLSS